jgi:hypothetical protein
MNFNSLSRCDSLILKCLAFTRKNQVEYNIPPGFFTEKCGFPLQIEVKKNWDSFSEDQKNVYSKDRKNKNLYSVLIEISESISILLVLGRQVLWI